MKLDLPYLMRTRNHARAPWRYYVRRGGKLVRVRGEPGEPGFMAAYHAALGGTVHSRASTVHSRPRTWRWLCEQYMASPEWAERAPATRAQRQRVMQGTWDEPLSPGSPDLMCDCPLEVFGPKHARVLRDRKRDHPEAANHRLKLISSVFRWACEAGHTSSNPARDVSKLRPLNREGHHTWTVEEVRQYERRHPIGTKARLALALFLFTGGRISDVGRIGRPMVQEQGWLRWTVAKTGQSIEIPIAPELQAVIDATPLTGMQTWLVTQYGKPFSVKGLGNWFRDRCNEAGLPHCSAHGLRKAGATIMAENGARPHQLMAYFGWTGLKQAELYTRKADRRRLAGEAGHLLSKESG